MMQVDAELGEIYNKAVEPDPHHLVAAIETNKKMNRNLPAT